MAQSVRDIYASIDSVNSILKIKAEEKGNTQVKQQVNQEESAQQKQKIDQFENQKMQIGQNQVQLNYSPKQAGEQKPSFHLSQRQAPYDYLIQGQKASESQQQKQPLNQVNGAIQNGRQQASPNSTQQPNFNQNTFNQSSYMKQVQNQSPFIQDQQRQSPHQSPRQFSIGQQTIPQQKVALQLAKQDMTVPKDMNINSNQIQKKRQNTGQTQYMQSQQTKRINTEDKSQITLPEQQRKELKFLQQLNFCYKMHQQNKQKFLKLMHNRFKDQVLMINCTDINQMFVVYASNHIIPIKIGVQNSLLEIVKLWNKYIEVKQEQQSEVINNSSVPFVKEE